MRIFAKEVSLFAASDRILAHSHASSNFLHVVQIFCTVQFLRSVKAFASFGLELNTPNPDM
jgi:hypothetical protein